MSDQTVFESFEYVNLADIDPTDKPLPTGMYELQVLTMKLEKYTPKSGPNAGVEKERISASFAVVGDNPFAGRRLFHRFYLNPLSLRDYRKMAEVTGVNLNQPADAAALEFSTLQPTFKTMVVCKQQLDWNNKTAEYPKGVPMTDPVSGKPVEENEIQFRQAVPA